MESSGKRVLIVAHRTAATPALIETVRERAQQGDVSFTLLVPNPTHGLHTVMDPEDATHDEAAATIELATPLLEEAVGSAVDHIIGVSEPLSAIQDAMNIQGPFDEIIISTLPKRVSRWVRLDLPHKAAGLRVPVTTVTARGVERLEAHSR